MDILLSIFNGGITIVLNLLIIYLFFLFLKNSKGINRSIKRTFYFLFTITILAWILSAIYGYQVKLAMNDIVLNGGSLKSEGINLFSEAVKRENRVLLNILEILQNSFTLTLVALVSFFLRPQKEPTRAINI
jgi:hypothetical protein